MAQFDLFRLARNKQYPYVLDIQADLLRDLATRVVVPLAPLKRLKGKPIGGLNPIVTVGETDYVVLFQELAAIPTAAVGEPVGNLRERRGQMIAALDLLFTGV